MYTNGRKHCSYEVPDEQEALEPECKMIDALNAEAIVSVVELGICGDTPTYAASISSAENLANGHRDRAIDVSMPMLMP